MPKIRQIEIKNFRSIRSLTIETNDLTTLVGDNDSGKSNILRALNLFFSGQTDPGKKLDFNVDYNRFTESKRGKSKRAREIEINITFELPYNYQEKNGERVIWRKKWREVGLVDTSDFMGLFREETKRGLRWIEESLPPRTRAPLLLSKVNYEYIPAIRGADVFLSLRGRMYGVIAETAKKQFSDRSADFQASIKDQVRELLEDLDEQLGDKVQLALPENLTQVFEQLDFLNETDGISLEQRGDGIKARYIPIILKFMLDRLSEAGGGQGTVPNTFIWGYEEPENNLEYRRAIELASSFSEMVEDDYVQVLLTTHSPVFYNKSKQDADTSKIAYISQKEPEEGTIAQDELSILDTLDDRMGVMPIIAPHIEKANKQIDELKSAVNNLNEEIEAAGDGKRPAIFFEGRSDRVIFRKLIELILDTDDLPVYLPKPPPHAGANYVVNNLLAWQYRTINLPKNERYKAIGIVDDDKAGRDAKKTFDDQRGITSKHRYAEIHILPKPKWFTEVSDDGLNVPITLEEMYPLDYWGEAIVKGWLEKRKRTKLLSDELNEKIINGDTSLNTVLTGKPWDIIINYKPKADIKTKWANWVVDDEGEEEAKVINTLPELAKFTKEFLKKELKIKTK